MAYRSIWQILGLDGPTRDVMKIRKAYASKAKMTNPEDDPEGFEQLHNAYHNAMRFARSNTHVTQITVPSDEPEYEPEDEPDVKENSVSKDNEEPKESFDFSSVRLSDSGVIEEIKEFRRSYGIESFAQVDSLNKMTRISIVKLLTQLYQTCIARTGDEGLWYLYWDEPVIHYFEADPDFRKWVLDLIRNQRQKKTVQDICDHLSQLPREYKWTVKVPKQRRESRIKLSRPAKNAVISVILFIMSFLIGTFLFNDLSMKETLIISLACSIIHMIYSTVDDMIRKKKKK